MYEDYLLDENFRVEAGFVEEREREGNMDEALGFMAPCKACGEWVNKNNLWDGYCNCCRISEFHMQKRSESAGASSNYRSLEGLVKRLEVILD